MTSGKEEEGQKQQQKMLPCWHYKQNRGNIQ